MGARCQRGVTDDGLCIGVCMVGVLINNAVFQQVTKATFTESVIVACRQVTAESIHCYLKDKFWFRGFICGEQAVRQEGKQNEG
jgi:hypothetical protein